MSNFKVGQKVVCVIEDNSHNFTDIDHSGPKINEIVTISWMGDSVYGRFCLGFKEYNYGECWDHYQFRPLDHAFGERIAAEIIEKVKQEQLIEAL